MEQRRCSRVACACVVCRVAPHPPLTLPLQTAANNQGATTKPVSRRYTQMSFGSNQQVSSAGRGEGANVPARK